MKRKTRNEATKERRIAIKAFWEKRTQELNSKTSDFFKSFKPFLGSKKGSAERDIIKIEINGEIEKDQNVVAEELSKYFSASADDIGGSNTILLTENDFSNHSSVTNITNNYTNTEQFSFSNITKTETTKALESLNPTKSTGWDMIPPKILKLAAKDVAPSLTNIFNLAINSGEYLNSRKRGEWIPVQKKDERNREKEL